MNEPIQYVFADLEIGECFGFMGLGYVKTGRHEAVRTLHEVTFNNGEFVTPLGKDEAR